MAPPRSFVELPKLLAVVSNELSTPKPVEISMVPPRSSAELAKPIEETAEGFRRPAVEPPKLPEEVVPDEPPKPSVEPPKPPVEEVPVEPAGPSVEPPKPPVEVPEELPKSSVEPPNPVEEAREVPLELCEKPP